jgi:hypothetical protein
LLKIIARLDLWFISQNKLKGRNNAKFSILKKIGFEFYGQIVGHLQTILCKYLDAKNKEDLPIIIKLAVITSMIIKFLFQPMKKFSNWLRLNTTSFQSHSSGCHQKKKLI